MESSNSSEAICNLNFDGKLSIEEASEIKEKIIEAFSKNQVVNLDLTNISDIDLSGIQLICSSNLYFEKNNKKLILKAKNQLIKQALNESGYINDVCQETPCNKCLWKGDIDE